MTKTYSALFPQVVKEINKRTGIALTTTDSRYSVQPSGAGGSIDSRALAEIITTIASDLAELIKPYIMSGLDVTATTPSSMSINISAGTCTSHGRKWVIESDAILQIPVDNTVSVFFVVVYNNAFEINKTHDDTKCEICKIIIPQPGITSAIVDDKPDDGYDGWIISAKDIVYTEEQEFDDTSVEKLRDVIGRVLADNLIGNIRLSENLKITNTQGSLELDSSSIKILSAENNVLAKFNRNGTFFYNEDGEELAKFSTTGARVGNISITQNSIQSTNFVSGNLGSGFKIQDSGDAEFNNVLMRGKLTASVFEKDTISAVGGSLLVMDADILDADMSNLDNPTSDIIVDNNDSNISVVGTWSLSTSTPGYYGINYQFHTSGTGTSTFSWLPVIALSGNYEVFAIWTASSNRATNAKYTITTHEGNKGIVSVNQKLNHATWYSLGIYNFQAGGTAIITLSDNADEYVIADAIKLVYEQPTMKIIGDTSFAIGDILRIKDGVDDEWLIVTDNTNAPIYKINRDRANAYQTNEKPAWKKGTSIVNYGQSGEGGVYLSGSETNSPYMSVVTHNGEPWSILTTHLRVGNLNGFLEYVSDLYGIGIGSTDAYLKYDPTNGLTIKGKVTITGSDNIGTPDTAGLYFGGDYLGYYSGAEWLVYITNTGQFTFKGDNNNYIIWSGSTLTIRGALNADDITAGTIDVDRLAADSITADKYNQLRNTLVYTGEDSLDTSYPYEIPFRIVSELVAINSIKLSFKILSFRAYSTGVPSGGGSTTVSGGGSTTVSGGGSTSGAVDASSNHTHTITLANGTSAYGVYFDASTLGISAALSACTLTTSSSDSHTHTLTVVNNNAIGNVVRYSGGVLVCATAGVVLTDTINGHYHTFPIGLAAGSENIVYRASDSSIECTGGGTITSNSTFGTTHTHTTPNHTHATPDHTHATPSHAHDLTFAIYEEANSPTINVYVDNGAGYGASIGAYTVDQLDIDLTASVSGVGWKKVKFTTTARCRIASIIECKLDIEA